MEFFDTIRQVKSNWNPYRKWEFEQQKKEKQNQELRKKYPPTPEELKTAKQYGRTLVDVINTMDQYSIDKAEDASLVIGNYALGLSALGFGLIPIINKGLKALPIVKKKNWGEFTLIISMMLSGSFISTVMNILQAKYEKQASRIARFQTRETDLKDPRHFIIYDEAQLKEAKELAKTLPEIKENKKERKPGFHPIRDYKDAEKTTREMTKEYDKYQEWKKNYLKEEALKPEKFKNLNPSKEELLKAEKDRDAMLNTIKKIETSSLNYVTNIEMAVAALMGILLAAGTCVGLGINAIIDRLIKSKVLKESKALAIIKGASFVILPIITTFTLLGPTIKLKKDAARVGRYKAKQELLNNPENFVTYTEGERKKLSVSEESQVKPEGFFARLKKDAKDIKKFKKDYDEYKTYMNTQHKEEMKLDEALKQVKISDTQKTQAQQLQKKAFHSFEKMDEKAQRFTDDTDAAVDITGHVSASIIAAALRILSVVLCGAKLKEHNGGKMPKGIDEIMKSASHLTGKEVAVVLTPFILPEFIAPIIKIAGTQVKKDAGKIGVMTAMNDLDDPKNFLDEAKDTNLLTHKK